MMHWQLEMGINITKQGWIELSLEKVCSQIVGGGTPSTKIIQYWQGSIPWITSADILDIKTVLPKKYITVDAIKNSATNIVPRGTIIVVTRVSLGKIAIAPFDLCFSQDNQGLIFYDNIVDANYALFYLYTAVFSFKYSGRGTTINGVTKNQLKNLFFRFPPLPEQRAIVAKIEQLFSELDSGVENLKKAQAQLKVYRQAVLKWAFEGKLTEEWRKKQKDLPTAETLLAQIKTEREKQAEKSNKKLKPIPPISKEELAKIPELPEGWCWVKIDVLHKNEKHSVKAGPFGSALKKEFYVESGYKVYGQEQVISGDSKIGDYFINEEKYKELESCKIKPNDILISLVGTIGKVLILPENCLPGIINPRLIKISLNTHFYLPIFFKYYFESSFLKNIYKANASGTTMDVLNLGVITELPFTFCSVAEQQQIVQEIEDRLSVCDKLEETIAQSLQKVESLRQSILKKAFTGKLLTKTELEEVRNATDWEPAEKLLQRIKKENEKG